jgi:hypothetical protein
MRRNWRDKTQVLAAALLSLVLSFSRAQAQHLFYNDWKHLADESSAVVVGDVVQGMLHVVDTEKEAREWRNPDGSPRGGNPVVYTVGMLARVRVGEAIKNRGKIKPGDTIRVLVYGYGGTDLPDVPMDKEKRVFFLRPVDPNGKEFEHAVIQIIERTEQNGHPRYIDRSVRFDPKGCYTPVENGFAQVLVPPDKLDRIDKIKRAIAEGH